MTREPRPDFWLRPCVASAGGAHFDVCAGGDDHPVGTILVGARGNAERLEVLHPAYFYRFDGQVINDDDRALLTWLSDMETVNAALAKAGGPRVRSVAWREAVSVSGRAARSP